MTLADFAFPKAGGLMAIAEHVLECNREQVLSRSLMHCHAKNVHSITFVESGKKTIIRMFVAEPGHELWGNSQDKIVFDQSVAFHPHHCDVTLFLILGNVMNWIVEPTELRGDGFEIGEYQYQSAITHGKIGFTRLGSRRLATVDRRWLADEPLFMEASKIHTIAVPEGQWAAWFVLEGRENPEYKPICWSMMQIDKQDFSGLYKPMDDQTLSRLMAHVAGETRQNKK